MTPPTQSSSCPLSCCAGANLARTCPRDIRRLPAAAAAAAAVEAAARAQGGTDNSPTCYMRCLCVAYDARDASMRFSKVWAEREAPSSQTKISCDERKRRLQKLVEKTAGQLCDGAGGWHAFDMQPINSGQPSPYLDSANSPWRITA